MNKPANSPAIELECVCEDSVTHKRREWKPYTSEDTTCAPEYPNETSAAEKAPRITAALTDTSRQWTTSVLLPPIYFIQLTPCGVECNAEATPDVH
jgi:hypothetical protein